LGSARRVPADQRCMPNRPSCRAYVGRRMRRSPAVEGPAAVRPAMMLKKICPCDLGDLVLNFFGRVGGNGVYVCARPPAKACLSAGMYV
jgi:hypothetical protein